MYANLLYCNLIQLNCDFSCSVATFTFVDICWWFLKGNKSSVHHFVFSPSNCCLSCTCARFHFLYMCFQEGVRAALCMLACFGTVWVCTNAFALIDANMRKSTCKRVAPSCVQAWQLQFCFFATYTEVAKFLCLMIPVCLSTICFIELKVASSILNSGCLVIVCLLSWEKANN